MSDSEKSPDKVNGSGNEIEERVSKGFATYSKQTRTGNGRQTQKRPPHNGLGRMTISLLKTMNSKYNPQGTFTEILTFPSEGAYNNNYDNSEHDYILKSGDTIIDPENREYEIEDLLGKGTFGQVVRCRMKDSNILYAVKVIKNKQAYRYQAMVEVRILSLLNKTVDPNDEYHIVRMNDYFVFREHLCIVFEMLDVSLYDLLSAKKFKGITINLIRVLIKQVIETLMALRAPRIIHCDLKPENILLKRTGNSSSEVKVIDLGSACFEGHTIYTYIQSRHYRSPEVLLGLPYNSQIDLWSLGCITAELYIGVPIFPGSSEYDQLKRIFDIIGYPTQKMINDAKNRDNYFKLDANGVYVFLTAQEYEQKHNVALPESTQYFNINCLDDITRIYKYKKSLTPEAKVKEQDLRACFVDFLRGLLTLDSNERWTSTQVSKHPFVLAQKLLSPYIPEPDDEEELMQTRDQMGLDHESREQFAQGSAPSVIQNMYLSTSPGSSTSGALDQEASYRPKIGQMPIKGFNLGHYNVMFDRGIINEADESGNYLDSKTSKDNQEHYTSTLAPDNSLKQSYKTQQNPQQSGGQQGTHHTKRRNLNAIRKGHGGTGGQGPVTPQGSAGRKVARSLAENKYDPVNSGEVHAGNTGMMISANQYDVTNGMGVIVDPNTEMMAVAYDPYGNPLLMPTFQVQIQMQIQQTRVMDYRYDPRMYQYDQTSQTYYCVGAIPTSATMTGEQNYGNQEMGAGGGIESYSSGRGETGYENPQHENQDLPQTSTTLSETGGGGRNDGSGPDYVQEYVQNDQRPHQNIKKRNEANQRPHSYGHNGCFSNIRGSGGRGGRGGVQSGARQSTRRYEEEKKTGESYPSQKQQYHQANRGQGQGQQHQSKKMNKNQDTTGVSTTGALGSISTTAMASAGVGSSGGSGGGQPSKFGKSGRGGGSNKKPSRGNFKLNLSKKGGDSTSEEIKIQSARVNNDFAFSKEGEPTSSFDDPGPLPKSKRGQKGNGNWNQSGPGRGGQSDSGVASGLHGEGSATSSGKSESTSKGKYLQLPERRRGGRNRSNSDMEAYEKHWSPSNKTGEGKRFGKFKGQRKRGGDMLTNDASNTTGGGGDDEQQQNQFQKKKKDRWAGDVPKFKFNAKEILGSSSGNQGGDNGSAPTTADSTTSLTVPDHVHTSGSTSSLGSNSQGEGGSKSSTTFLEKISNSRKGFNPGANQGTTHMRNSLPASSTTGGGFHPSFSNSGGSNREKVPSGGHKGKGSLTIPQGSASYAKLKQAHSNEENIAGNVKRDSTERLKRASTDQSGSK